MVDVEVFGAAQPITDELRSKAKLFRESGFEHVEVWVDDVLVYSSAQDVRASDELQEQENGYNHSRGL